MKMNISEKLRSKSPYLKGLAQRKKETMEKVEEEKAEILINKVLGRDRFFVRDYSIFSYNKPAVSKSYQSPRLKITPGIKIKVKSQTEIDYPKKYQQKEYIADSFAMMYKKKKIKIQKPKPFLNCNNANNHNTINLFTSAGSNIVSTIHNKNNLGSIDEGVMVTNKNFMKNYKIKL